MRLKNCQSDYKPCSLTHSLKVHSVNHERRPGVAMVLWIQGDLNIIEGQGVIALFPHTRMALLDQDRQTII